MLTKTPIYTDELRPIEQRGTKRATPLIEMSNSNREELLAMLLSLSQFSAVTSLGYWQTNTYNTNMLNMYISSGHLRRQVDYLTKGTQ